MKRPAAILALTLLLPLAGCVTPYYGPSQGAWANYDPDYDWGYDGYDRPVNYASDAPYGPPDYAGPPAYGPQPVPYPAYQRYAPAYSSYAPPVYAPMPAPAYGPAPAYVATTYYYPAGTATYYQGPGYGPY